LTVTFLGTGTSQGVPVIGCSCKVCNSVDFRDNRLRTSILISANNQNVVVDTGPDFRQQMLRERVSKLDAVIFTHQHKDHTAGMDDVRSFNFLQDAAIPVYARQDVLDQLKREYDYVFAEHKYPGIPKISVNAITSESFNVCNITFIPIEVMHHRLSVFGYRIGNFTYITDANFISDTERAKIRGSKVLVLNALRKSAHISHFSLEEAIEVANDLNADSTYLTHISHGLGKHREVSNELPPGIELAYDGLKIHM